MFWAYTDKADARHIHAHSVLAVRDAEEMKIHPGPQDIRYRLVTFAEHAQPQGLKIVAAFAAEHASLQTDGLKDRAIVDAADHRRPSREARYRT